MRTEEYPDEIKYLKGALTQAHKERDEAVAKIIKWGPLVESYELQVKELSAACAVMREALRALKIRIAYIGMPQEPFWMDGQQKIWDWRKQIALLENALHNTDCCGKAFLERMKEAEWLLANAGDGSWRLNYNDSQEWLKRREAWIKGGAK